MTGYERVTYVERIQADDYVRGRPTIGHKQYSDQNDGGILRFLGDGGRGFGWLLRNLPRISRRRSEEAFDPEEEVLDPEEEILDPKVTMP